MCVCFSVRNQLYCNYFAVAVVKLTKIVVCLFFFCGGEKLRFLCVSRWKHAAVWKLLFPSSRRILCFLCIPDIFPASTPSLGADDLPCLISASDASPKLFIPAQWLNRLSQKKREEPAPGETASQRVCHDYCLVCTGFLWWFRGGWLSGDLSHEQVKHGLRFFISHVKPDLKKN